MFEELRASLKLDTSGFKSGVQDAQSSLDGLQDRAQETGQRMQSAGKTMTAGITAPLAAMGGASAKAAADFDQNMQQSIAVMDDVSEGMRNNLEQTARDVATSMSVSHNEAAESFYYLSSAGLDAQESLESMPEVARFAEAGQMDMARATDVATNVMSAYGYEASEMTQVTDTLSATVSNHNQTMEGMSSAMSQVSPVASSLGVSIEETSAAIGMMGDVGIQAEKAGTQLRNVLSQLSDETSTASQQLEEMGVKVRDSEGNLLSMTEIIRNMEQANVDASQATQIFGRRAGPAMAALLEEGAGAMEQNTQQIEEMDGATKEIAETQRDTFNAQLNILKSNLRDVGITIGENLLPVLNNLMERLTPLAESFQGLSERQQRVVIAVGSLAAAIGPLAVALGTLLTLAPQVAAGFGAMGTALTALTGPIGVVVAALAGLAVAYQKNLFGFRDAVQNVVAAVIPALEDVATYLRDTIPPVLTTLRNRAETAFGAIESAVTTFVSTVRPPLENLFNWLGTIYSTHLQPLEQEFTKTWNHVRGAIEDFTGWVRPHIETVMGGLETATTTALNAVTAAWNRWGDDVMAVVDPLMTAIQTIFETNIGNLVDIVSAGLALIRGDFDSFEDSLMSIVDRTVGAVVDAFQWLADRLIGNSIVPDMLADILTAVSNWDIAGVFGDKMSAALDVVSDIAGDIKDTAQEAVDVASDAVSDAQSMAGDAQSAASNAADAAAGAASSAASGAVDSGSDIVGLDTGGVIEEEGLFYGHEGEHVYNPAKADKGNPDPPGSGDAGGSLSVQELKEAFQSALSDTQLSVDGEFDAERGIIKIVDGRLERQARRARNRGVRR